MLAKNAVQFSQLRKRRRYFTLLLPLCSANGEPQAGSSASADRQMRKSAERRRSFSKKQKHRGYVFVGCAIDPIRTNYCAFCRQSECRRGVLSRASTARGEESIACFAIRRGLLPAAPHHRMFTRTHADGLSFPGHRRSCTLSMSPSTTIF